MMRLSRTQFVVVIAVLATPLVLFAGSLQIPHVFQSGGQIRASEMNENFAAVQAAVNSGGTGATAGGTRLKKALLVSADGAVLDLDGYFPRSSGNTQVPSTLFDSQLGVFCAATFAVDGKLRCLPITPGNSGDAHTGSAGYVVEHFEDAGCTTLRKFVRWATPPDPAIPGLPVASLKYGWDTERDGSGIQTRRIQIFEVGPAFTGDSYEGQPGYCNRVDETLFELGAEVPPETFAEFTAVLQ